MKEYIQRFRDRFTSKISVWNGVAIRDTPIYRTNDFHPVHKQRLWNATKKTLTADEDVVFVGGGKGVVPIKTAEYGHTVTVIEAAKEVVDELYETATLNQVEITIQHALVESGYDIYGDGTDADRLTTDDLDGDVLVLDCEGAERDILPAPQFETVIVETHPQHGATTHKIRTLLDGDVSHYATARHKGDFLIRQ